MQSDDFNKRLGEAKAIIRELPPNSNEAETRRRVERILESLCGYDPWKHLSREQAVKRYGTTEHMDFCVYVSPKKPDSKPSMIIELKPIGEELRGKHWKQVQGYSVSMDCPWALLTNGKQWELLHIDLRGQQDPVPVATWDLLQGNPATLQEKFDLISFNSLRKGNLEKAWKQQRPLTPAFLLRAILSDRAQKAVRSELKKVAGSAPEVNAITNQVIQLLREDLQGEAFKIAKGDSQESRMPPPSGHKGAGKKAWETRRRNEAMRKMASENAGDNGSAQ